MFGDPSTAGPGEAGKAISRGLPVNLILDLFGVSVVSFPVDDGGLVLDDAVEGLVVGGSQFGIIVPKGPAFIVGSDDGWVHRVAFLLEPRPESFGLGVHFNVEEFQTGEVGLLLVIGVSLNMFR